MGTSLYDAYKASQGPTNPGAAPSLYDQYKAGNTSPGAIHAPPAGPRVASESTSALSRNREDASGDFEATVPAVLGNIANVAQGIPGMEAVQAGARAGARTLANKAGLPVQPQSYRQALSDIRGQTDKIPMPMKMAERMIGAIPIAAALPGSAAVSGALVGGADEALSADPDESLATRGVKTAVGLAGGALLGKGAQKAGTIGRALLPTALGGAGGADANVLARQAARAASAKSLYGAALNEGRANEITPQLSSFLQEEDIAPIVARIQAGRTGSQLETPELLDRVYKELSDLERAAKKPLAGVDPSKPNLAVSRLADIRAAKNKMLTLMSSPGEKPPLSLDIAPEVHDVEPVIQPGRDAMLGPASRGRDAQVLPGHETITGPIPEGTAGLARGNASQVSVDASGRAIPVSPRDVQGPAGPSFMLRGQPDQVAREAVPSRSAFQLRADPGKVTPGVRIETPGMRIQTAPAEALPAPMPSYQKAVDDFAQRTREIEAVKKGYQAVQGRMSGNLPGVNSLGRKTPLAFEEWAKTASPEQLAAARQGVTGAVRDAASLPSKTFAPLRRASSIAGPLLRSTPSPNQGTVDVLRNLGLLDAGDQLSNP